MLEWIRFKKSIAINAPIEQVFTYLADLRRHGQWDGEDIWVADSSAGAVGVGSWCLRKATLPGDLGNYTVEKRVTVTEFVPNVGIAFKDRKTDRITTLNLIELERFERGTRITMSSGVSIPLWFWPFWIFLAPVFWPAFQTIFWLQFFTRLRRIRLRLDPYYINQEENKRRAERQRLEEKRLKQVKGIKVRMVQRVSKEPGIAHTKLSGSVKGEGILKQEAIRRLLDEKGLICEQKGRVRRYFVQR